MPNYEPDVITNELSLLKNIVNTHLFFHLWVTPPNSRKMPNKSIFNRLVRCQELKIISIRREIRNQHVEMHRIPSMEEKSPTSSAKPVSLLSTVRPGPAWLGSAGSAGRLRPPGETTPPRADHIIGAANTANE